MQSSSLDNYFSEVIDSHYSYIEPYNSNNEIPPYCEENMPPHF